MATTNWSTLPNFTTYFGTVLHGAEVTWYNNPAASGTAIDDKDFLHIKFTQNLHAFAYTWWDSANTLDAAWFVGNFKLEAGQGTTIAALDAGGVAIANTWTNTLVTAAPNVGVQDIVFAMQFTNPIAGATPARDGFRVGATPIISFAPGTAAADAVSPTAVWSTTTLSLLDLSPAADFQWTDIDAAAASNACDTTGSTPYVHADSIPGDWT